MYVFFVDVDGSDETQQIDLNQEKEILVVKYKPDNAVDNSRSPMSSTGTEPPPPVRFILHSEG